MQVRAPRQISARKSPPTNTTTVMQLVVAGDTGKTHVKGATRSSAAHKLQHTGDQIHLCTRGAPTVVERERGPVLTDMGPHTLNGGSPDAADDTEEELHRLSVYETDPPPRDKSVAPKRKNRIVVQIHGHDYALGHSNWALKSSTFSRRSFMP